MRAAIAVVLAALSTAATAGKVSCYEERASMKHWCFDPADVRANGSVRMSPVFTGGPRGVDPTGMFFVVDCEKKIAAMQDRKGVNVGGNYSNATPMSRSLTEGICGAEKVKKDASVRLR